MVTDLTLEKVDRCEDINPYFPKVQEEVKVQQRCFSQSHVNFRENARPPVSPAQAIIESNPLSFRSYKNDSKSVRQRKDFYDRQNNENKENLGHAANHDKLKKACRHRRGSRDAEVKTYHHRSRTSINPPSKGNSSVLDTV